MKFRYTAPFLAVCLLSGCGGEKVTTANAPASEKTVTSDIALSKDTTTSSKKTPAVTKQNQEIEPPDDLIIKALDSVEVYDEIPVSSFITEKNVELKEPDALINTSDTGVFEVEIPYIYNNSEFIHKLQYSVVDTTAPVILNSGWSTSHKVGTDFDLNDYVGYADNFDRNPVITYSGAVDSNTVGEYPLIVSVTDSSGNASVWDVTISVVDEIPVPVDNNPRVNFSDFIARYDCDNVRFGIDVSAWQSDVDYEAVRNAGCSFVMIRIGYFYDEITMDDYFRSNIEKATAAGLDVGVYFYTTVSSAEKAREHARWISEQLNGRELDLPVAFDWEEFGNFQKYGMSIHDLNDIYSAFADEIENCGYSAILYSSKNFLNNFWSEKTKAAHPVWLAHFVDETDYEGEYAMWQASAYGHIPGINGDVDMDIQYLDREI